jgi:hypothetical protein
LNSKWKRIWIEDQQVPFIFQGNVMIGYDDVESIGIKVLLNFILFCLTNSISQHKHIKLVELYNSTWIGRRDGLGNLNYISFNLSCIFI